MRYVMYLDSPIIVEADTPEEAERKATDELQARIAYGDLLFTEPEPINPGIDDEDDE